SMRILIIFLLLLSSVTAQQKNQKTTLPTMDISRVVGEIKIDGDLFDPGWQNAVQTDYFTQYTPVDNVKPPVETRVYAAYDDQYLYLGFNCFDDPSSIRATLSDRDDMFSDDFVGIILDTYGNAAWSYEFYVNPLGVQGDLRWVANNGEDSRFDIVFESAGKITEKGWQSEIAIPFSSLRFPDKEEQIWRATFWRSHPRDVMHKYSWAPLTIGEACFFCQFGYLTGIKNVKPGSKLDLLPSLIGYQSSELNDPDDLKSGFRNDNPDADLSLDVCYQLGSGMTAEAAVNPDFSQIESDAAQIDVNTNFALFYPERRPFFQEGSDLYSSWIDAIYTRSVNNPDAAFKLTGRMDKTSFFYLAAHDENSPYIIPLEEGSELAEMGKSTSNIGRIKHSIFEDSFIGGLFTDRRLEGGGYNTVVGTDALIKFFTKYRILAQILGSRTEEPENATVSEDYLSDTTFNNGKNTVAFDGESYNGKAIYVNFGREARLWSFDLDYYDVSPNFRANNGFVTQNNRREVSIWSNLIFRPNGKIVSKFYPSINVGRVWNYNNIRKDEWIKPMFGMQLTGQTNIDISFVISREMLHTVWFDDIRVFYLDLSNSAMDYFRFGTSLSYGNSIARTVEPLPVMGRQTNAELWFTFKPLKQFVITPEYSYYKLLNRDTREKIYEGYIIRTKLNYQFTRELFFRLIVQYNDFGNDLSFEPLLTYKINPFTIFYVGSSHGYDWDMEKARNAHETGRQFFLKFQYLFRSI
ncbi:MAG: carbohydrate binding family 9 domain-containing protein, partial [bacterium]